MKSKPAAAPRKKARFGSRRGEVVALLQKGIRTVSDLALQLRLTDNAVRSHLVALEREGLGHERARNRARGVRLP